MGLSDAVRASSLALPAKSLPPCPSMFTEGFCSTVLAASTSQWSSASAPSALGRTTGAGPYLCVQPGSFNSAFLHIKRSELRASTTCAELTSQRPLTTQLWVTPTSAAALARTRALSCFLNVKIHFSFSFLSTYTCGLLRWLSEVKGLTIQA